MVLYGAGTEVPTRLIHELAFPVVDVWSGKGGTKNNFNNLSNKVITTYLRETMTEQNATVSATQLCLRPHLQLQLHIIHPTLSEIHNNATFQAPTSSIWLSSHKTKLKLLFS
jgi:hypothetical protein